MTGRRERQGAVALLRPDSVHQIPSYLSAASVVHSSSDLVFVSGHRDVDPSGRVAHCLTEQTRQAIKSLATVARETGCEVTDLANVTVYVRNSSGCEAFNDEYRRLAQGWAPPRYALARTLPVPCPFAESHATAVRSISSN